ncbi:MAG: SMC-Scp complex subunit ScpB [Candidatus Lindowbacteria bacterium]|nr:SMC-Scp complex subunit ScpB [Candidatus Lindowbacteria bacterium]
MESHDEMTQPADEILSEKPNEEAAESAPTVNEDPEDDQGLEQAPNAAGLSDEELCSVMEVLLLVSDRPLSVQRLREVLEGVATDKIEQIIRDIQKKLTEQGFPFHVREVAGGYVLSTLPKYGLWVRKLYSPKITASKLSRAALETLAVIAYKQPVTRAK